MLAPLRLTSWLCFCWLRPHLATQTKRWHRWGRDCFFALLFAGPSPPTSIPSVRPQPPPPAPHLCRPVPMSPPNQPATRPSLLPYAVVFHFEPLGTLFSLINPGKFLPEQHAGTLPLTDQNAFLPATVTRWKLATRLFSRIKPVSRYLRTRWKTGVCSSPRSAFYCFLAPHLHVCAAQKHSKRAHELNLATRA